MQSKTQCVVAWPKQQARPISDDKVQSHILQRADCETAGKSLTLSPKIDGILSKLRSRSKAAKNNEISAISSADLPAVIEFPRDDHDQSRALVDSYEGDIYHGSTKTPEVLTSINSKWINNLNISPDVLHHLLAEFRRMSPYFPFVPVSDEWRVIYMAEQRPFLLLVAINAASSTYPQLQNGQSGSSKQHSTVESSWMARKTSIYSRGCSSTCHGRLEYLCSRCWS